MDGRRMRDLRDGAPPTGATPVAGRPALPQPIRPNRPALKSRIASAISAWLFITNGP